MAQSREITRLLQGWRAGDGGALEALTPLVYQELRRLAAGYFRKERPGHTLQPTALVHEAYINLVSADVQFQDRAHFFALAARMMRRLLVDHALARGAAKRGGDAVQLTLSAADTDGAAASDFADAELLSLEAALNELEAVDPRKARLVELHYFGGLGHEEMASATGVSRATVQRELRSGRAWLASRLGP